MECFTCKTIDEDVLERVSLEVRDAVLCKEKEAGITLFLVSSGVCHVCAQYWVGYWKISKLCPSVQRRHGIVLEEAAEGGTIAVSGPPTFPLPAPDASCPQKGSSPLHR